MLKKPFFLLLNLAIFFFISAIFIIPKPVNATWQFYRSITINSEVQGTENNFPLYINIPSSTYLQATSTGGSIQNVNGYDITFTANPDCTDTLDFVIQKYDSSIGALTAQVNVPTIKARSKIYMCYGDSDILVAQAKTYITNDSSLLGYWPMDEGTGTSTLDFSGNGNDGSWHGAAAGTSGYYSSGKVGSFAGNFNGSNNYVNVLDNPSWASSLADGVVSIEAWIYEPDASSNTTFPAIAEKSSGDMTYRSDCGQGGFYLSTPWRYGTGGQIRWAVGRDGEGYSYFDYSLQYSQLHDGGWHHLVGTSDADKLYLYYDGQSLGSVSRWHTGTAYVSNNLNIGAWVLAGRYFSGLIDDVRVYNRTLSADWIANKFNNINNPSLLYSLSEERLYGTPEISSFLVDPLTSAAGLPVTLSWTTWGADTLSIDNGVGNQSEIASGSISVFPTANTTYTLTASNEIGFSSAQESVIVAPSIPSNLSAVAKSATEIDLSWTPSTSLIPVAGYKIYRCAGSSCTPSEQIATSSVALYADNSLPDVIASERTYTYVISAYDIDDNTSLISSPISATVLANYNLQIVGKDGGIYNSTYDYWNGGSQLGTAGVFFADLNSNGKLDVIVGASGDSNNSRSSSGSVYIIYDSLIEEYTSIRGTIDLSNPTNYNIRFDGALANDYLSYGGITLRDIDGNGKPDILIGAEGASNNSRNYSGSLYVIYDSLIDDYSGTGNNIDLAVTTNYNLRYDGAVAEDYLSMYSMAVEDLDGNGKSDILVGAAYSSNNSRNYSGSLYVIYDSLIDDYSGTGNNIDLAVTTNYNLRYDGAVAGDELSYSLLQPSDLNNNGKLDILVGAGFSDNNSRSYSGSLYVIYDSLIDDYSGTGNNIDLAVTTNYNLRYDGAVQYSYFTQGGAVANDLDNNGKIDLLLGDENGPTGYGALYVIYDSLIDDYSGTGNNIDLAVTTNYNLRYDGASGSLAYGALAVEDFNSNGKQDIIVGEPWATQTQGYLYVIYDDLIDNYSGTGNNIGMSDVANYSLRYAGDGDSNFIYSEDPKYGFVVDINGDGKVDLAPSNYYATFDSKHNVGSVYIIYNFPHAFSLSPVSSIITSNYLNISGVVDATLNSLTNISGVEYSLDSNDPSGVWVSCNATDGMFNGKIESFSCSLSSLAEAAHTVYIRAYDRNNSYTAQSHYASDTFIVNTHGAVLPPLPLAGSVNNQNNNNPVNTNTPTNTTPAATNGTSNSTNVTTPIASMLDDILSEAKILAAEDTNQLLSHLGIGANVANEQAGLTKYKTILDLDKTISANSRMTINDFIVYGTLSTKHLGAGERAAVINSYYRAYSRLPDSEAEWSDALKIANGRWPSERNTKSEAQAKLEFKKVYARDAVMSNNIDENAIMIIAYGLMPLPRNLNNERIAITTFRWVYGHNPVNALAWNIVRAIAYGGAGR